MSTVAPDCSNCPCCHPQLFTEPSVSGFSAESWVPCHEIRKGLDLARRFHNAYTSHPSSNLCQSARHSEDQIGLSNGINRWHKEWETAHDTPVRTKLRERAIHQGLLTSQRFDQHVHLATLKLVSEPTWSTVPTRGNRLKLPGSVALMVRERRASLRKAM
jgi:hypothetical protein